MSIAEYTERHELLEEKDGIEKILSVLENGENPTERENYRTLVRDYQNYLVLFLKNERGSERIFTISGLHGVESMPVFLTEEAYRLFQNEYLGNHGYLEVFKDERETPMLKSMNGRELFEIIPQSALGSVFVISQKATELFFNFNLAEVFTDCFRRDPVLDTNLVFPEPLKEPEIEPDENDASIGGVKNRALRKIEQRRKIREILKNPEWTVLISQPTKNKLLKGEFSRDDFAMDQHGDGRVFAFSGAPALDAYKEATGQMQEKLYSIKVESQMIFGADLSRYNLVLLDPYSSDAAQIDKNDFKSLNELFTALEIERKLSRIEDARKNPGHYFEVANFYVDIKKFGKFIVPVNVNTNETGPLDCLPIDVFCPDVVTVFTAADCFEAFRLASLEKIGLEKEDFIEPRYLDGERLFYKLIGMKDKKIIFNPSGPGQSITFEPDIALKIYCA